jgi:tricorn protease
MKMLIRTLLFIFLSTGFQQHVFAIDNNDTRLLWQPTISKSHIAFVYAEDLWVANLDGTNPKRITASEGIESNPIFSPDGTTIAFTGQYDGNIDVFVISVNGGTPKRLTWHAGNDLVRDFSPDGKKVLFASQRNSFTSRYYQLFTVDINNGSEIQLPVPNAFWASYSSDGNKIAYTTLPDAFEQWKNYRGGRTSRIWIYDIKSHVVTEIPKPKEGCNDSKPVWDGENIYFRSDRNGEFNLYSYDLNSKLVKQLSKFTDFPISSLDSRSGALIFAQSGYLHTYNIVTNTINKLKVGIAADLLDFRPRFVKGDNYIRFAHISPTGNRVVVDFRGDIITIPGQKGDQLNITNSPAVHEKFPKWSPDGKLIAYFSDANSEYALHIKSQNGIEAPKIITLNGSGFYAFLHWSPDSKKLCFVDNGRRLYVLDIASGNTIKIAEDTHYSQGPFRELFGSWSADGNFVSYTTITETNYEKAWIYAVNENKSYPVSDGLSNVTEPKFDPSGKYLYMLASTDAGPVVNWFDQSNQDMDATNRIYLVMLQKSVISPFTKENDTEDVILDSSKTSSQKGIMKIDWEGMENRIIPIPISNGYYSSLSIAKEGELYYLSSSTKNATTIMLHNFSLKKRKEEPIMPADDFEISSNGLKMLFNIKGKWGITAVGQKPGVDAMLNTSVLQVKIAPQEEWKNIFNEAWRVNRDYFYDPGMHGVNWEGMRKKYAVFLPEIASNNDLYKVMEWMFSELSVGHHRFSSSGDRRVNTEFIPGGLLGADYEVLNNRYRIKKIYGGLNWSPNLRSPLTEPGVNIKTGDYIISVNGQNVTTENNFYSFFENTAEKIVTLTVSDAADESNARTLKVTPIANENALRNRDWVEGNIKKVAIATNDQVAYIYVPNTAAAGHEYFKRYFFPQANKAAIIIDERFNGGGQLADYVIDLLKKPAQSYWNYRYGKDQKAPNASIQGPKVMLIDENAGSGGDYLPYLFRKEKLGTIIGKTTWGGLVGILGFPEFIDGGVVTAPNLAFYDENGFGIENVGTPPDIEVEQWPVDVIMGKDPQLEKAIQVLLEQLKKNPVKKLKTPAYPIKVRK